jgi:hypothetical protein
MEVEADPPTLERSIVTDWTSSNAGRRLAGSCTVTPNWTVSPGLARPTADWLVDWTRLAVRDGTGLVAVVVKTTGEPTRFVAVAVTRIVSGVVFVVRVVEARPFASVNEDELERLPAPDATAHVTWTPVTGLPAESVTETTNGLPSTEPAAIVWLLPEATAIRFAGLLFAVAVKTMGLFDKPVLDAQTTLFATPGDVPSVSVVRAG